MAGKNITLFGIHLDGPVQIGPATVSGSESPRPTPPEQSNKPGLSAAAVVVGVMVLAGLALALKKVQKEN